MSQTKHSEEAKHDQIKRELTITIRVLENEHEAASQCIEDGDISNEAYDLEHSLMVCINYFKDLRNDWRK